MKFALILAFLSCFSGGHLLARSQVNGIAAIVNGKVVTQSEVKEAVRATENIINMSIPPGAKESLLTAGRMGCPVAVVYDQSSPVETLET